MHSIILSTVAALLILLLATASTATTIGVTYNADTPDLPSPELVAARLNTHNIKSVRLLNPTPDVIRAFAHANISILLSVPNSFLYSFATDSDASYSWLIQHVLPFHLWTRISLISVGTYASADSKSASILLRAIHNLHKTLTKDLGIKTIPVSTTFSYESIISTSPSSSKFQERVAAEMIHPLLQFLEETNSSLLVNLYPYNDYRSPIGFALFEQNSLNFKDDAVTGTRYWNLFDMMMGEIRCALAFSGHPNIPLIVAETGWPDEGAKHWNRKFAEMYLNGLIRHLRSEEKKVADEVYIYQLFDDMARDNRSWGIMHSNMTMKYDILPFHEKVRVIEPIKWSDMYWLLIHVCLFIAMLYFVLPSRCFSQ